MTPPDNQKPSATVEGSATQGPKQIFFRDSAEKTIKFLGVYANLIENKLVTDSDLAPLMRAAADHISAALALTDENGRKAAEMRDALESARHYLGNHLVEPGRTVFWKIVDALKSDAGTSYVHKSELEKAHLILDADESKIVRNTKDSYPAAQEPRDLTLAERVSALCKYAADWKQWNGEAEAKLTTLQAHADKMAEALEDFQEAFADGPENCSVAKCDEVMEEANTILAHYRSKQTEGTEV